MAKLVVVLAVLPLVLFAWNAWNAMLTPCATWMRSPGKILPFLQDLVMEHCGGKSFNSSKIPRLPSHMTSIEREPEESELVDLEPPKPLFDVEETILHSGAFATATNVSSLDQLEFVLIDEMFKYIETALMWNETNHAQPSPHILDESVIGLVTRVVVPFLELVLNKDEQKLDGLVQSLERALWERSNAQRNVPSDVDKKCNE